MKKRSKKLLFVIVVLLLLIGSSLAALYYINLENNKTETYYLSSDNQYVEVLNDNNEIVKLYRGLEVDIKNKRKKIDDIEYCHFIYQDNNYYPFP